MTSSVRDVSTTHLADFLFVGNDKEWNTEQDRPEARDCVIELSGSGELVGGLQTRHQIAQLQADRWKTRAGTCFLPVKQSKYVSIIWKERES